MKLHYLTKLKDGDNALGLPTSVKLVEVGPRDGLQNENQIIASDVKIEFINQLSQTGLSTIEVTSFVSPKWVPQMADNALVFSKITKNPLVSYSVLVPNLTGFVQAVAAGAKEVAIITSASETFSQKNTNRSIAESLTTYQELLEQAQKQAIKVRGYISCVFACPFEDKTKPAQVSRIARELYQMGCYEISLGDTIGVGTPMYAKKLIDEIAKGIPLENIAVHFHDTYGQALANIFAVLEQGVAVVDASVAGIGGCPYAKGATGNVASEDVVYLLHELNITTGIDLEKLCRVGYFICKQLNRATQSKVAKAYSIKQS
jgi:hydroxymethylglutaryl-CoA lyase